MRGVEPPPVGRTYHWLREEVAESGRRLLQLESTIESLQHALNLYEAENAWLWAELNAANTKSLALQS